MNTIFILETIHQSGVDVLRRAGEVETLIGWSRQQILDQLHRADAVVCKSVTQVDREFIDAAAKLRLVGRAGTGTDNFDKPYLQQKNIPLLTVPRGNSVSAAEFAVMCILMLAKRAVSAIDAVRSGDFRRDLLEGRELQGLQVGLLGYGNVGRLVAERLRAFGCRLLVHDSSKEKMQEAALDGAIPVASVGELLAASEVVSLHATYNDQSKGAINCETLRHSRPGLWLVNIARGGLMVDDDVISALDTGQLAGLAIDTLSPEPPFNAQPGTHSYDHPYLHHPRVVVFPHMAASTDDAQERIAVTLAQEMCDVMEGWRKEVAK